MASFCTKMKILIQGWLFLFQKWTFLSVFWCFLSQNLRPGGKSVYDTIQGTTVVCVYVSWLWKNSLPHKLKVSSLYLFLFDCLYDLLLESYRFVGVFIAHYGGFSMAKLKKWPKSGILRWHISSVLVKTGEILVFYNNFE